MERENFEGLDLFGNPIPKERRGPGKPPHEWTVENSNKINLMFAVGSEPKDAAKVLGISMPTLRKYYFSELEKWRDAKLKLKAALLQRLYDEGVKGNVGAIKELFKHMEAGALAQLAETLANRKGSTAVKGKKEQQKEAADSYSGKFAPPDGPSLLN